jgi:hypothetical protein
MAITTTATQNRGGRSYGKFTIMTTGASGTAKVTLESNHDLGGTANTYLTTIDPARSATNPTATTIDTTVTRSTELRMRLSAATATVYLHLLHCTLRRTR